MSTRSSLVTAWIIRIVSGSTTFLQTICVDEQCFCISFRSERAEVQLYTLDRIHFTFRFHVTLKLNNWQRNCDGRLSGSGWPWVVVIADHQAMRRPVSPSVLIRRRARFRGIKFYEKLMVNCCRFTIVSEQNKLGVDFHVFFFSLISGSTVCWFCDIHANYYTSFIKSFLL